MEIGFAVGGAFRSSSLNVLFDRLAPHGDLLKMFQKHKHDDGLLEKLDDILLGLQTVLSDAENKKASNPLVRKWLNKLQRAMDGAESLLEEVNYEDLRLKVEDQLRNLAETSNQQVNTKGLLQEVGSFDLKDDNNVNQLQVKLKESLKGKRFLVVLDDLWNDDRNEWDDLRNLFVEGAMGSKIMVTTRKENVARMMDSGAINLGTLSSDVSWALFKRHSLKNRDPEEHPELEEVGKQIADKCKGLPLALKALAGILRRKSEVDEWKEILRSELCEQNLNGILPALMLSYNDLPAHLKQCFAYCAIYPKDYQFCKEQVIHLWIANGLVQQLHSGNQYFNELRSRSLFERVPESSERDGRKFLMHDLVNDLAQTASSKLCVRLEECQGSHILEQKTLLLSSCACLEEPPLQMEKLINLRHLDISKTSRLKMPLHLSKLKSLQVLVGAEFLLGGSCGWRMEDLGGAHYFESDADNSQTEREILDELCPHIKMKELQISGYRGTQFPNWLANHSFLKLLVQLSLSNCMDCFSLPALGQLPSLKFLSIRGMLRITEVTEEFYGSPSSKKPFNSLEKLEFAEMPEWKQWHVLGIGEFPALQDLSIDDCPKLMGKLPENLCSLTKLRISGCPELNLETPIQLLSLKSFEVDGSPKAGVLFDEAELFTSQLEGMKQIEELRIRNCNSLTSLPTSTLPSTLKKIRIHCCRKLKLEAADSSRRISDMFLEVLGLDGCDSISSAELVPRACYLEVRSCQNLTRFLIPNGTGRLDISWCENLETLYIGCCVEILSVACGTQMMLLFISDCKKLKRLPERMQELLPSLKELYCEKLVNGRKEWRLQRLLSLRELYIIHNGSDEEIVGGENWELPCSIQRLFIGNLKTLSSQLLKSLTSLEYLRTDNLPQIKSLLEQGLPSSLSELRLSLHDELHSLPTECLGHLTSLRRLEIINCPQLQSLAESALPSSLSELTIWNCPNLQSLPVKRIPSSLSKLSIYRCQLLKPLLEFDKESEWL
ncbi:hypothetical protein P3S68_002671 [Capsicum galapagoense]